MCKRKQYNYDIQYTRAADRFLKSHEEIRVRYEDAVKELLIGDHPEKVDVKRVKGKRSDYFRIKLGGYRVIYTVLKGKVVVINVILAGSRGDVYKKMNGFK